MDDEQTGDLSEKEMDEARSMGWAGKDEWRGDPDAWVDAKTFLQRGRTILPILQKNNEGLRGQLTQLSGKISSLETSLQAANATIEALEESHAADLEEQVKAARAQLRKELAAASRDGDHDAIADITEKMTQLNDANIEAGGDDDGSPRKGKKPEKQAKTQEPAPLHPEVAAWYSANPDFVKNRRKVALASVVAQELRENGDLSSGAAFLDKVAEEVDRQLGNTSRGSSKVAAGNGGGGRGGESSANKTYADLPPEAKAACDRQASRLVGPNRRHKTLDSWHKSYVSQYFKE